MDGLGFVAADRFLFAHLELGDFVELTGIGFVLIIGALGPSDEERQQNACATEQRLAVLVRFLGTFWLGCALPSTRIVVPSETISNRIVLPISSTVITTLALLPGASASEPLTDNGRCLNSYVPANSHSSVFAAITVFCMASNSFSASFGSPWMRQTITMGIDMGHMVSEMREATPVCMVGDANGDATTKSQAPMKKPIRIRMGFGSCELAIAHQGLRCGAGWAPPDC
jgi:hypothetical protein